MIEAQTPSGIKRPVTIRVRDAAAVAQPVKIVQVRNAAGEAKTVWAAMTATASPPSVTGYASSSSSRGVSTSTVAVTVEGGVGAITYAWVGTGGWSISMPTSATTNFVSPLVGPGDSESGFFTCTATDSIGQTASAGVSADVANTYIPGGIIP